MKIFISYSEKDVELVNKIKDALARYCEAYIASEDVQPGQHLLDKIVANIKSSNYLIVLMTKNAKDSPWVQQEIGIAKASQIPIIQVVESGVDIRGVLA